MTRSTPPPPTGTCSSARSCPPPRSLTQASWSAPNGCEEATWSRSSPPTPETSLHWQDTPTSLSMSAPSDQRADQDTVSIPLGGTATGHGRPGHHRHEEPDTSPLPRPANCSVGPPLTATADGGAVPGRAGTSHWPAATRTTAAREGPSCAPVAG